jgi:hypothetical protein
MITLTYSQGWNNALYQLPPVTTSKPCSRCSATPTFVVTADTYTSVLPDLPHHAAEAPHG